MAKKLIQITYQVNDAALLKSAASIKANENAAKKADDQVKKYGKDAEQAGNQASKSFMNLGNVWKGLVAIGITAFFVNLAKKTFELGVKQEQLTIAFNTFLGSAQKAKKLLAELNKFAIITPFTPDQVNNAAKALLAFGVRGEEIIPTLKMLGDVSSGTGKDLTEMAIIFGQIKSTGRLMGQDLLQLINAGFNPLQIISKETGRSMMALKKDMEAGAISFEMVEGAFKKATSEGGLFFNLMEKQSKSVGGLLSTVEGNIDEILKNIFTASSGPIKDFVDQLVTLSAAFLRLSESGEQAKERRSLELEASTLERYDAFVKTLGDTNKAKENSNLLLDFEIKKLEKRNNQIHEGTRLNKIEGDATVESMQRQGKSRDEIIKSLQSFGSLSEKEAILRADRVRSELDLNLERIDQLKDQKKALEEYIFTLDLAREDERAKAAAKALELQAEALKKLNKEREKAFKFIITEETEITKQPIVSEDELIAGMTRVADITDSFAAERAEKRKQAKEKVDQEEIDAETTKQDKIEELKRQAFDYGLNLLGQFLMASINSNDEIFKREEGNFKQRTAAAGDNERALQEIAVEKEAFDAAQDKKAEAFNIAQAKKDKERRIKQMIIENVLNVIKSVVNSGGIPAGIPAGLIAAAYGAVQVAIAKSVGFKEGGWIDGPGTEKSDSIPIMASRNEFMINASSAKRSPNLLEAINAHEIDDRILTKLKVSSEGVTVINSNKELVAEFKKSRTDYYEQGHVIMKQVKKSDTLTQHLRGKYHS